MRIDADDNDDVFFVDHDKISMKTTEKRLKKKKKY